MRQLFARNSSHERGGSLIEFAIALPFLLIVFVGLTELGTQFSEKQWIMKSAYQATLKGGQYTGGAAEDQAHERYTLLFDWMNKRFEAREQRSDEPEAASPAHYDPDNRTVSYDSSDNLKPMLMSSALSSLLNLGISKSVGASYVGPVVAPESGTISSELSEMGNANGRFYDCWGHPSSESNSVSCANLDPLPPPPPMGDGSGGGRGACRGHCGIEGEPGTPDGGAFMRTGFGGDEDSGGGESPPPADDYFGNLRDQYPDMP